MDANSIVRVVKELVPVYGNHPINVWDQAKAGAQQAADILPEVLNPVKDAIRKHPILATCAVLAIGGFFECAEIGEPEAGISLAVNPINTTAWSGREKPLTDSSQCDSAARHSSAKGDNFEDGGRHRAPLAYPNGLGISLDSLAPWNGSGQNHMADSRLTGGLFGASTTHTNPPWVR